MEELTLETLEEKKEQEPLISVQALVKLFPITSGFLVKKRRAFVRAVDGVSFSLSKRETLAIVGESGCGKTTLAKLIIRLIEPTSGSIKFEGIEIGTLRKGDLQHYRKRVGVIFQDPFASLDPRMSIGRIIEEPMRVHGIPSNERKTKIGQLLELVGLKPEDSSKFPHQFSGGQRQRIATARALALSPSLIVADEPTSSLDVSVQAKIINLFMELQRQLGIAFIFISHDLSVVRHVSNRVVVMYLGKIVESANTEELFKKPLHPYTRALLASVPIPDTEEMKARPPKTLAGEADSIFSSPEACRFQNRCPYVQQLCRKEEPAIVEIGDGHMVACHFWREIESQPLQTK